MGLRKHYDCRGGIRGEIFLTQYNMIVNEDMIYLIHKNNSAIVIKLEIKEKFYREKWLHALQQHIYYAS